MNLPPPGEAFHPSQPESSDVQGVLVSSLAAGPAFAEWVRRDARRVLISRPAAVPGCCKEGACAPSRVLTNCLSRRSASIVGCTISESVGRGFVCRNADSVEVRNSTFALNKDGAALVQNCTVDIERVIFRENTALGSGAAIRASRGSSISMRNFSASLNRAEIDGGGVYYDASDGGSFFAEHGVFEGNAANTGRGGGLMLKHLEATAVTIALTEEYGKVTGAVTNGTHMVFFSQAYVFAIARVQPGPGRGTVSVLSGVMWVAGYRDGQQNSASPPLYLHPSHSTFVMSPDMTKIYYCEKFSGSIRVISIATGDSSTIAGGHGAQGYVKDGIGAAVVISPCRQESQSPMLPHAPLAERPAQRPPPSCQTCRCSHSLLITQHKNALHRITCESSDDHTRIDVMCAWIYACDF